MTGLLIVNADDWGGFPAGTDAIERCFTEGAITSATAMVWMSDSARAAEIALDRGRPTGLHLNLTQPFEDTSAPPAVRERQREVCAIFRDLRVRRWTLDPRPRVRALVRDAVRDQLDEYRTRYGAEPTHVDGHHHVQVCPDVALALAPGTKVRQTLTAPAPHARLKHAWLARRFRTTTRFRYFPDLTGPADLAESHTTSVEVMCHPSFPEELPRLLADDWLAAVKNAPAGTYRDL